MSGRRKTNKFEWFDETRPLADRIEEAWNSLYIAMTNKRICQIYMQAREKVLEQHRRQNRKRMEEKRNADNHQRIAGGR